MKKFFIVLLVCALCAVFCLPVFAEEETDDRLLTLVNPWNTLPEDWTVELVNIGNGHKVDKTCYDDLMAMLNDECLNSRVQCCSAADDCVLKLWATSRKAPATVLPLPSTSRLPLT